MAERAYVVIDLGFGDAGKGLLTDFLARHFGAGLVVRYNGGAQAGHNVVTADGCRHTFTQFGSGTFIPGVKTILSRHVVVHPAALLLEGDRLVAQGAPDIYSRMRVSEHALVITPFHQAANRLRELARVEGRHGSCGVGVGEAVEDALLGADDVVRAIDLSDTAKLEQKLRSIRRRKLVLLSELYQANQGQAAFDREWQIFTREDVIEHWMAAVSRITEQGLVVPDSLLQDWLANEDTVIFEGAQGVLLDQDAGFHPYTTWSRCTTANADEIIRALAPEARAFRIGVLRCYAVRHGPGPLPTETPELAPLISEHNQTNDWQGAVRYGWFDAVLARYALRLTGPLDSLLVTHMDVLPRLNEWRYCPGYTGGLDFDPNFVDATVNAGVLSDFRLKPDLSLEQREEVTRALENATPLLEACEPDESKVIKKIESLTGQPVGIVSRGQSAEHVKILNSLPT